MTSTTTINPTTGGQHATHRNHTDDELAQIVASAHDAFGDWRRRPLRERAGVVAKVGERMAERADDLAKVMTDEMGKLISAGPSVQARMSNNGETCVAAKRFVVVDSVYDEFRDAFVERMGEMVMGDPNDPSSGLGPMAREDRRDELHEQVTESIHAGANLALPNLPFGGVKDSGYGREHGGFGIKEFVNIESVMIMEP